MIGALLVVAQLAIVSHAPDTAATCDAIEISVAVRAPGGVAPIIIAPSLSPFDVLRSSGTPRVTFDSRGGGSVVAEYRYVVTTDRVGTFALAPFEARLGSAVAHSRPTFISVRQATRASIPTVIARARVDTSLEVNFRALSLPETVFVGQQANYEVAVFLNETVRDRLRRNPTFFPPDMQSMLAYDLPTRADPPRRQVGSHCYDALVYQRALFPLMPGRFSIPPAQLVYSLPLSASFFSREETHDLQTDSTVIVAIEPPAQGRPSNYGGAVGNLRVAAKLDTNASRVGDPLRLTVRVSGSGNVKLFPRPAVGVPWGSLVKGDERVQVDTTARRIAGSKEFDWVLTPKIAGELDLPPIRYSYFNPESRRYEVATTATARVHVNPGTLASADTAKGETLLPLRTRYRGAPHAPLHEHPVFWAFLALAPLPALSLGSRERRRRAAMLKPVSRVARLERLAHSSTVPSASDVRRIYTAALAERLRLEAESFTRPTALARVLRRRGVSAALAQSAERFLRELDEAAFAKGGALPADAPARAMELYRALDAEALPRTQIRCGREPRSPSRCSARASRRRTRSTRRRRSAQFDLGVAAYERHDFVAAREAFIASVSAEPNAPDAWADLGTAAWAVADTGRSVAAWQRALRIEPLAADVRDRVGARARAAVVVRRLCAALSAAWLFNCRRAALVRRMDRRGACARNADDARSTRGIASVAVCAGVIAIVGFALGDRLSGRRVAVIRRTASLNVDPQLGSERGATAIIGEVVRSPAGRAPGAASSLDDGRDGWIENAGLVSLDAKEAAQTIVAN